MYFTQSNETNILLGHNGHLARSVCCTSTALTANSNNSHLTFDSHAPIICQQIGHQTTRKRLKTTEWFTTKMTITVNDLSDCLSNYGYKD